MNYRDEFYKNIVDEYYAEHGRVPQSKKIEEMGIDRKYIQKKYGTYTNFVKQCDCIKNNILVVLDVKTKEEVMRGSIIDVEEYFNDDHFVSELIEKYQRNKSYKGYMLFKELNFEVYKRLKFNIYRYRIIMNVLFDEDVLRKDRKYIYEKDKIEEFRSGKRAIETYVNIDEFQDLIDRHEKTKKNNSKH